MYLDTQNSLCFITIYHFTPLQWALLTYSTFILVSLVPLNRDYPNIFLFKRILLFVCECLFNFVYYMNYTRVRVLIDPGIGVYCLRCHTLAQERILFFSFVCALCYAFTCLSVCIHWNRYAILFMRILSFFLMPLRILSSIHVLYLVGLMLTREEIEIRKIQYNSQISWIINTAKEW